MLFLAIQYQFYNAFICVVFPTMKHELAQTFHNCSP